MLLLVNLEEFGSIYYSTVIAFSIIFLGKRNKTSVVTKNILIFKKSQNSPKH